MRRVTTFTPGLAFSYVFILVWALCPTPKVVGADFSFGVNADNWTGDINTPGFVEALKMMKVDFIVWHLSPEEEVGVGIDALVDLCRKNGWAYLFNTELVNYVPGVSYFSNPDGTYRWDLKDATLEKLKDDPLFLGQVYDEPMLMQSLNGASVHGRIVLPYFANTSDRLPVQAFDMVTAKIKELNDRLGHYGKRAVFEMVYPDYAAAPARAGVTLAPKLMKENPNDLMFAVYAGAARQYDQAELWACADLWLLEHFPERGIYGKGFHTPEELFETLSYAYSQGFDRVYVEHIKGLIDMETGQLTDYGRKVVEFQTARETLPRGDWRTFTPELVVKRFPDGNWGQKYSAFLPDHPYGTKETMPILREATKRWLELLSEESSGKLPPDANNWNAMLHPYFQKTPYFTLAGLPQMLVFDHTFERGNAFPDVRFVDLTK